MLRVGLTGELGSGKSTVARLLAAHGAIILSSDEMARAMMQPGESVYQAIVDSFGPDVLLANGQLDRPALARLAFDPAHPRVEELNAMIHPAVLAEQERQLAAIVESQPDAIVVIESALIFTTKHVGGEQPWRTRFDRIVLVTAPDELKVERFVQRTGGDGPAEDRLASYADAQRRLAAQRISAEDAAHCLTIDNTGDLAALAHRTEEVFRELRRQADDVGIRGLRR